MFFFIILFICIQSGEFACFNERKTYCGLFNPLWSTVFFGKPDQIQRSNKLSKFQLAGSTFDHERYKCSIKTLFDSLAFSDGELLSKFDNSTGFNLLAIRAQIGRGNDHFKLLSEALLNGSLTEQLQWVSFVRSSSNKLMAVGDVVATLTRFYRTPIWTLNPAKLFEVTLMQPLIELSEPQNVCTEKYSQIGYVTLENNLLIGEEMIKITLDASSVVHFEMMSYSRGSLILQPFMKFIVRPLQQKFFTDHIRAAKQLLLDNS